MSRDDLDRAAYMRGALTRRDLLRRAGVAGSLVAGASLVAACGSDDSGGTATAPGSQPAAPIDKTVAPNWTFSNWPLYIDTKGQTHPSIDQFDAEYNTSTKYIEDIEDNDTFFGKVKAQLEAGQDIGRDLVILTDPMATKWVALNYCEKLDKSLLPNVEANQSDALRGRSFDPKDEYLVPWQSGQTAIGYDPSLTGGKLSSIMDIFDPSLSGKVTLLSEMQDTLGLVMLGLGKDPTKATTADVDEAIAFIEPYVANGHIRKFTGNEYAGDLAKGNVWACFAWSGDVVQLQFDNPKLEFLIPEEGCMIWTDNMMIPANAAHPYNAHLWMDYSYRPEVAAQIAAWVNYICTVDGAKEVLLANDPETAENPLIFPPEDVLAKSYVFKALSPEEDFDFNQKFEALIGN